MDSSSKSRSDQKRSRLLTKQQYKRTFFAKQQTIHNIKNVVCSNNFQLWNKFKSVSLGEENQPQCIDRNLVPQPIKTIHRKVERYQSKTTTSSTIGKKRQRQRYTQASMEIKRDLLNRRSYVTPCPTMRKGSRVKKKFIPLEKKNEDNQLIEFYRHIKENFKGPIDQQDTNADSMKEKNIKKYKEIIASANHQKRNPYFTFSYQGEIIPVTFGNIDEKHFIQMTGIHINEEPDAQKSTQVQPYLRQKQKRRKTHKLFYSADGLTPLNIQIDSSEFKENFKKFNLQNNYPSSTYQKKRDRAKKSFLITNQKLNQNKQCFLKGQVPTQQQIKIVDKEKFEEYYLNEFTSIQFPQKKRKISKLDCALPSSFGKINQCTFIKKQKQNINFQKKKNRQSGSKKGIILKKKVTFEN